MLPVNLPFVDTFLTQSNKSVGGLKTKAADDST